MKRGRDKTVTVTINNTSARLWTQHGATCQGEMLITLIMKQRRHPQERETSEPQMDADGGAILAGIIACSCFTVGESITARTLWCSVAVCRSLSIKPISLCVIEGRVWLLKSGTAFSCWPWTQPESVQGFRWGMQPNSNYMTTFKYPQPVAAIWRCVCAGWSQTIWLGVCTRTCVCIGEGWREYFVYFTCEVGSSLLSCCYWLKVDMDLLYVHIRHVIGFKTVNGLSHNVSSVFVFSADPKAQSVNIEL